MKRLHMKFYVGRVFVFVSVFLALMGNASAVKKESVKELTEKQKAIEDDEKVWTEYKADILEAQKKIEDNQGYTIRRPVLKVERVPLPPGEKHVVCHACSKTCDRGCNLPETHGTMGHPKLGDCPVMNSDGICKGCGHGLEVHSHSNYSYRQWVGVHEEIYDPKKADKDEKERWKKEFEHDNKASAEKLKNLRDELARAKRLLEAEQGKNDLERFVKESEEKLSKLSGNELARAKRDIDKLKELMQKEALMPFEEFYLDYTIEQAKPTEEDASIK